MRGRIAIAGLLALGLGVTAALAASLALPPPPMKIILAGDSTMAQQTGWGGAFCDGHVDGNVACLTMGRGGRSTKTYRAEGTWQLVLNELETPGYAARYVLIEFGHNDKAADPAIGTQLATEYPRNLARMVAEVRARHAEPILLTSLATRHFQGGKLADSMAPWAAQVRMLAAAQHVTMVDLSKLSEQAYAKLGPVGALQLERRPPSPAELAAARGGTTLPARMSPGGGIAPSDPRLAYTADYIHLNARGAALIAGLVAQGLMAKVPALRHYLVP